MNNVCRLLCQQILVNEVYGQFVLVCLLKVLYLVRFLPHCKHMARRQPEISWNSSCGLLWLLLALNLISHLQNLYKLRTTFKIKLHAKSSKFIPVSWLSTFNLQQHIASQFHFLSYKMCFFNIPFHIFFHIPKLVREIFIFCKS